MVFSAKNHFTLLREVLWTNLAKESGLRSGEPVLSYTVSAESSKKAEGAAPTESPRFYAVGSHRMRFPNVTRLGVRSDGDHISNFRDEIYRNWVKAGPLSVRDRINRGDRRRV